MQELSELTDILGLSLRPVWVYSPVENRNLWGNGAALELFGTDEAAFSAPQQPPSYSEQQAKSWKTVADLLTHDVQENGRQMEVLLSSLRPGPGIPPSYSGAGALEVIYKPVRTAQADGTARQLILVQVTTQHSADDGASGCSQTLNDRMRMVEMCNHHPMFQFLFDSSGHLLIANRQAMINITERLGPDASQHTLQRYLSVREVVHQSQSPEEHFQEAMHAIFVEDKPCHRFPQLRASKKHPGKYRWVLYEMWPLSDPVTHEKVLLVCEQNITQVKMLEEQFRRENERLEAHLEEALAQRDPVHKPAIDIDTPADKVLKLLDRLMRGHEVDASEAVELRDAICQAEDLRQPLNFNEQVMNQSHSVLDVEVGESLIQLLSSRKTARVPDMETVLQGGPALTPLQAPAPARSPSGRLLIPAASPASSPQAFQRTGSKRLLNTLGSSDLEPGSQGASEGGWQDQPSWSERAHEFMAVQRALPEEMTAALAQADNWQFDAFRLNDASNGRPLSMLAYYLFKRSGVIERLELNERRLIKFFMRVEEGYPDNPYHNRIHAADVLQGLHVLLWRGNLMGTLVDDSALLASYLSAVIHDFEHPGVNNDFLIRTSDVLAMRYNDRSPLENHHLSAAFHLMTNEEFNFMSRLSHKKKVDLRKGIIEMVLATDMKQHFAIHSIFQHKLSTGAGTDSRNSNQRDSSGSGGEPKQYNEDEKDLVIQLALKCADLGHLGAPREVHRKWVMHLEEEFFRQGDREKKNKLTVSPLMDREKNGVIKSQVGFFDIVALPLFQSFAQAFPDCLPLLESVRDNYLMWREASLPGSNNGP